MDEEARIRAASPHIDAFSDLAADLLRAYSTGQQAGATLTGAQLVSVMHEYRRTIEEMAWLQGAYPKYRSGVGGGDD